MNKYKNCNLWNYVVASNVLYSILLFLLKRLIVRLEFDGIALDIATVTPGSFDAHDCAQDDDESNDTSKDDQDNISARQLVVQQHVGRGVCILGEGYRVCFVIKLDCELFGKLVAQDDVVLSLRRRRGRLDCQVALAVAGI